ncbi:hypothetical protein HPB50_023023 [Hyalomma asiaticum]|uniref:Uncharacterized protein n=1 Tax=Hyalomma asiaticum TaxID=266040 RepID=A0ACB7SJT6_HYAAI|nr:hypothetical protein HPB50_023023 [Hyalomma asiaticum]
MLVKSSERKGELRDLSSVLTNRTRCRQDTTDFEQALKTTNAAAAAAAGGGLRHQSTDPPPPLLRTYLVRPDAVDAKLRKATKLSHGLLYYTSTTRFLALGVA